MNADPAVRQMHLEGCLRWPSVAVALESFERFCEQISTNRVPCEEIRRNAADIYLCCACANGDQAAQRLFEREAHDVAQGAIERVHRDQEFVRETLQEFWKKLLVGPDAKLLTYEGRGPLQAWLRIAAARLALDRLRSERAVTGRETDLGDVLAEQDFGPESTLTRARFHAPFCEALKHAVSTLARKDRNLLRMHLIGRCSIDQIGRAYHVHRATAARWLEQARERILKSVRRELELRGTRLTDSEFRSVARVVGGELELEIASWSADAVARQSTPMR